MKKSDEKFSIAETERRFEAALRGARIATPKPLKDMPEKHGESRDGRKPGRTKLTEKRK